MPKHNQPDWQARLPGEQWVLLDSVATAEAYLATYLSSGPPSSVLRQPYPNADGLYAKIRFPDRIPEHHVYVAQTNPEPS